MKKSFLVFIALSLIFGPLLMPPSKASAAGVAFTSISSQQWTSFALDEEGGIWAWGYNLFGQFGDGTSSNAERLPARIEVTDGAGTPVSFKQVEPGFTHAIALDTEGQIWTTGLDDDGSLGNGTSPSSSSWKKLNVMDGGSPVTFKQVAANRGMSYALDDGGRLWAWGLYINGGSTDQVPTLFAVSDGATPVVWRSISGQEQHLVGIDSYNQLWQIQESGPNVQKFVLIDSGMTSQFQAIAAGSGYGDGGHLAVALESDGDIWTWGTNNYGQLGDGAPDSDTSWSPVKQTIMDGSSQVKFKQVSGGNHHALALDADGNLWAWGKNNYGQLGDGTTTSGGLPHKIAFADGGTPVSITSVTAGYEHSFALDNAGRIWAWGGGQKAPAKLAFQPKVALSASKSSSTYLEEITLTAAATGDLDTPTGSVEFREGATVLGTVALTGGTAELNLSNLSVGPHSIVAYYEGDGNYASGASAVLTHTVVMPASPAIALTPSTTGDTFDPVTVSADVQIDGAGNGLNSLKWLAGDRVATDFASAGADIKTTRSFNAAANGTYTVYAKDDAGNEAVKTIGIANILTAGDATALEAAIADAQQALADHPAGAGVGQAPAGARSALSAAIDAAQAVAEEAANRTQAQLDAAQATLEAAIATFRAAVVGIVLTPPDAGLYGAGDTLGFTLTYRDAVVVTGEPRIAIALDGGSVAEVVYAAYNGTRGTPVTQLSFAYEVQAGLADTDGIAVSSLVDLPDGADIEPASGVGAAMLNYAVPDTSAVRVVSIPPALELSADTTPGATAVVTVTGSVYGEASSGNALAKLRWLPGNRMLADFEGGDAGTDILGARAFTVDANGSYTVYARDAAGNEAVQAVTVSAIAAPSDPNLVQVEDPLRKYIIRWTADKASRDTKWTQEELAAGAIQLDSRALFANAAGSWTLTLPSDTVNLLRQVNPNGALQVRTGLGDYELPVAMLRELSDRPFDELRIRLSLAGSAERGEVARAAERLGAVVHGQPLQLELTLLAGGTEQPLSTFGHYVTVTVPRPATAVQGRLFSAVYVASQQTLAPMPTMPGDTAVQWKTQTGGIYALLTYDKQFADVQGSWAEEAVRTLASMLVIKGIDEGSFAPGAPVTRAELTAMIVRALGLQGTAETHTAFSDVDSGSWYAGAVTAAVQAGIAQGDAGGRFRPDAPISRQEAAVMLMRAMTTAGRSPAAGSPTALAGFADAGQISAWAREAMTAAVDSGLIQGDASGRLRPQQQITRAETAAMLLRTLRAIGFLDA
ncbi:S-layer homology domain-containing protein [Cohnella sp. GCM10020058]|uniref:S-layer homology domain-containing protein n=1 Tax=Cohnella sp. GCM10020058 TaxID=3317330 RepID=UPI003634AA83